MLTTACRLSQRRSSRARRFGDNGGDNCRLLGIFEVGFACSPRPISKLLPSDWSSTCPADPLICIRPPTMRHRNRVLPQSSSCPSLKHTGPWKDFTSTQTSCLGAGSRTGDCCSPARATAQCHHPWSMAKRMWLRGHMPIRQGMGIEASKSCVPFRATPGVLHSTRLKCVTSRVALAKRNESACTDVACVRCSLTRRSHDSNVLQRSTRGPRAAAMSSEKEPATSSPSIRRSSLMCVVAHCDHPSTRTRSSFNA
mmetsp:Transcript_113076/g.314739  ORF Transcript_113076/g.314739 Transcript_113076/m.314739 type:complete len:254 (-) Transcript_113076:919-1680(-)